MDLLGKMHDPTKVNDNSVISSKRLPNSRRIFVPSDPSRYLKFDSTRSRTPIAHKRKKMLSMYNYLETDYARNKYAAGIVYHSVADGSTWEITLEDYLAENPEQKEADFLRLKSISDEIYRKQDRADYAQTKKNKSIHSLDHRIPSNDLPLDDMFIKNLDIVNASRVIGQLFGDEGILSDMQQKRFEQYVFEGLNTRCIAELGDTNYLFVHRSIAAAICKARNLFVTHR